MIRGSYYRRLYRSRTRLDWSRSFNCVRAQLDDRRRVFDCVRAQRYAWRRLGRFTFCRKLAHPRSDVRLGRNLGNQLFDLPLALVRRPRQELIAISFGRNRRELGDTAQVKASVLEHRKERWMLPRGACDADTQVSLCLR